MVPGALSPDPWSPEGHKVGGQNQILCSPAAAPQPCHSYHASGTPLHPCPEPPRKAVLPSTAPLWHWLLQSCPPPISGTAAMQKAASKTLLGRGSAASQGWQKRGPWLYTPGRGACSAQRQCPASPGCGSTSPRALPGHTPGRTGGSTALLLPQPRVPQSRGQLAQPWLRAGLPPLGLSSTGCGQAESLAPASPGA